MGSLSLFVLLLTGGQSLEPSPDSQAPVLSAPARITGIGRLNWVVGSTIGPASLLTGVLTSTWGTVFNHPREYGESFEGFAKRYGLRLTGVAASNVAEASLGVIWHEDPRYHRAAEGTVSRRFGHALRMTFLSQDRNGELAPAYARYIAIGGTNVLSDTWRPNGDRGPVNTMARIGMGFGGRLLGNMWDEFWPDVKPRLFFFSKR